MHLQHLEDFVFLLWSCTSKAYWTVKVGGASSNQGTDQFINNPYPELTSPCDPGTCMYNIQQETETWCQHLLYLSAKF